MESVKAVSRQVESYIDPLLKNPYLMAVLKITITLYASQMAPKLPNSVIKIFENTFFKIFAMTVMVYLSERDFQLAIMLAIVYVIGVNSLSGRGFTESFSDYSKEYKTSGNMKLIEPKSAIYPGCQKITKADLENMFDKDHIKLHTSLQYAYHELLASSKDKTSKDTLMKMAYATGLPYNIEINDENAPFVATILMYTGFNLGNDCAPPSK